MQIHKLTRIILCFLLFLFFLMPVNNVYASGYSLEELFISVFIESDGSANIVERRKMHFSEGTEMYVIIENLGKSEITDFTVSEAGRTFENIDNWNINASLEEKAFKSGVIKTPAGYELCWGIGDYGNHEYIVSYTVTNFIKQTKDSQMLFWQFVNDQTNIPPENVIIEIESDIDFSDEEERIWAFGFPGEIQFKNGKIIARSDKPLEDNHYVTVLTEFTNSYFKTDDILGETFEEIKEEAFVGSDFENNDDRGSLTTTFKSLFFIILVPLLIFMVGIVSIVVLIIFVLLRTKSEDAIYQSPHPFRRKYKEEYCRDFPYDGDYLHTYYMTYLMGLSTFNTLLTSYLLKWIEEECISIEMDKSNSMFKRNRPKITILNTEKHSDALEDRLFLMLKTVAGEDGIVNNQDFANWAGHHRKSILSWEKKIFDRSSKRLEEEQYVELVEKQFLFTKRQLHELTPKGLELEKRIYQFINYLHDYSLLHEHDSANVKIWDNMMIWAAYLGKTKVVMKQFKKLYPNYVDESMYQTDTILLTTTFASHVSNQISPSSSSSSGSGGSASSGGGGGSFGGGSGGGVR